MNFVEIKDALIDISGMSKAFRESHKNQLNLTANLSFSKSAT